MYYRNMEILISTYDSPNKNFTWVSSVCLFSNKHPHICTRVSTLMSMERDILLYRACIICASFYELFNIPSQIALDLELILDRSHRDIFHDCHQNAQPCPIAKFDLGTLLIKQ